MHIKRAKMLVCILLLSLPLYACSPKKSFPAGTFVSENGRWTITYSLDGNFVFKSGSETTLGTYSIHGDEFTWETDSYCKAHLAGKATYSWIYKDDTLTMKVKGKDECADRQAVLEGIAYHKKP